MPTQDSGEATEGEYSTALITSHDCNCVHNIFERMTDNDTKPFADATLLNNIGAELLLNGNRLGAIQVLVEALQLSRQIVDGEELGNDSSVPVTKHVIAPMVGCEEKGFQSAMTTTLDGKFVFTRPIRIEPTLSGFPQSKEFQILVSSVIIFNLALANHLVASGCKNDHRTMESHLRRAIQLYQCTYDLIRTENSVAPDVLLLIATLNNLGQACSDIGEQTEAEKCFDWLLSTVVLLVDNQCLDNISEAEVFLSNVLHLILPASNCTSAPAA